LLNFEQLWKSMQQRSGRSSIGSSQHDWGSCFPGRCCPRMEQLTVVCHVSVVTVDFQATFKDVFVFNFVLMALTYCGFHLPNTSFFVFFVCYVCLKFLD